jgi:hypothetical protein
MAVIVLDEKPDPAVVKQVTCRGCGSRLQYVPNDVKQVHGTDISGGPDGMSWVDCPKCGGKGVIRSW